MNKLKNIFYIFSLTAFVSCGTSDRSEKESKINSDTVETAYSKIYYEIRQNLNGAVFADTVKETKFLTFSNKVHPDKFEVVVLPGLLSKSKAILTISTDAHIIYTDTFETDYLVRYIFEPDTVPTSGSQETYDKYMLEHVQSLTKNRIEEYARKSIKEFFEGLYVNADQVKKMTEFGDIQNKDLYKDVLTDTSRKVIYFPCFTCDEGGYYLTYSTADKKAVIILAAD